MDLREVPSRLLRRHPWEVARARFFSKVLEQAGAFDGPRSILDVGAGDGYLATTLAPRMPTGSQIVCFDDHYSDDDVIRFAAAAAPGVTFTREGPPRRFDIILLLDVLEHVADDQRFLDDVVSESLAPGGIVLVSVPAWPLLFSRHDRDLLHHRRYTPRSCRHLLEQTGLTVTKSGGLFHGLVPFRMATAMAERLASRIGLPARAPADLGQWTRGPMLSTAVERVLYADNFMSHQLARLGVSLPGLSTWALCVRVP